MSDETAAVIAAEKARCDALVAVDREASAALFDEGFTYVHATGRVDNRASYLEALGKRSRFVNAVHSDLSVNLMGDVAVLTGNLDVVQKPSDGDARDVAFRFVGVWRKRGDAWLEVLHQNTKRT